MLRALILILFCAAGDAAAYDTSLNPDRWTSFTFNQSGTESSGANEAISSKGITDERGEKSSVVSVGVSVLVPVTNEWSVTTGVGTNLSHSQSDSLVDAKAGISIPDSTVTDNSAITYSFGFRRYFQGFPRLVNNPDRVPSTSLTFSGSNTVAYGAGRTQNGTAGTLPQDLSEQGYSLTADFRAPLDDEWTLIPSLEGGYSASQIPYTPYAAGSQSIIRSLTPGVEARYYLVGRNLISKDSSQNPDQWSMFFLDLGGTARITGQSQSMSVTGVVSSARTPDADSLSIAVGTRLPVTNHMTLRFQIGGALSHSSLPETSAQQGDSTNTPTINYAALLKYYFF